MRKDEFVDTTLGTSRVTVMTPGVGVGEGVTLEIGVALGVPVGDGSLPPPLRFAMHPSPSNAKATKRSRGRRMTAENNTR